MEYKEIVDEQTKGDSLVIKGDESLQSNFGKLLLGLLQDNHFLRDLYKK